MRLLKDSMDTLRAENIANFTSALVAGFEILQKVILAVLEGLVQKEALALVFVPHSSISPFIFFLSSFHIFFLISIMDEFSV